MNPKQVASQIAAQVIAETIREQATQIEDRVLAEAIVDPAVDASRLAGGKIIPGAVEGFITQDPWMRSKRVGAVIAGAFTTALLAAIVDPATQAAVIGWINTQAGAWGVVLVPLVGALFAGLSKLRDTRQVRA